MPDIRYVCLSDMHLGEEDSLLTNLKTSSTETDPTSPSPVMEHMVECLKQLILKNESDKKPTLILNGDILEMALTTINEAAMAFERFIELIMPQGKELFERIIYIPGNHDHHLWESARETQYTNYILKKFKPKDELPVPWHATNMFIENETDPVPSYFLTKLVQRYTHLKDFVITVAYPNFGLFKEDDKKSVVFHHGHYIESIYYFMSTLKSLIFTNRKEPEHVWDIEAENFAWIDFFWSAMGRSGEAGQDIELIYEKMQNKEQFKKLLYNFADNLAKQYDLPGWGDLMEAKILKWILSAAVDKVMGSERVQTDKDLSNDAEKGLRAYMNGPLRKQILIECKKEENILSSATFIFGHTHKPFQRDMNFKGYSGWVNVYNTGGWVVETEDPQPLHGGAVVLVDEDLNTTSVRVYNESNDPEGYSVKVEEATRATNKPNPFHDRIKRLVESSEEQWKELSKTIARTVYIRAQNLRARINEKP